MKRSLQPVILLLGAKSTTNPLDSIPAELSTLNQLLEEQQSEQYPFHIKYEPYLTRDLLKIQLEKLAGRVAILHFAGHSDAASLQTDDELVYSQHIANILKTWTIQPSLIFLNGCHNAAQVELFLDAGVGVVIATHRPIDDNQASRFAGEFYQSLFAENGEVTLQHAFERAGENVFLDQKNQPRSLNHQSLKKADKKDWDWGLFPQSPDNVHQWTIRQLISKDRPRLDKQGNLLNPYRGLESFREEDKIWFFGRERLTKELVKHIPETRFFSLLGASGSGKSSVVNAGVIPVLRSDENTIILQMRPGVAPFSELANLFAKALYPVSVSQRLAEKKALTEQLRQQQVFVSDLVSSLLEKQGKTKLVFSIDQFEEIFTHSEQLIIKTFLVQLVQLVKSNVNCTLLLIMRADFLSSALSYPKLAEVIDHYPDKKLAPMGKAELRAAIEKPANKQRVQLEPALIEALLDDVDNQSGSLPLLQYVLSLLWEKRQNSKIRLVDYNAFGGLEKALETRANEIYQRYI